MKHRSSRLRRASLTAAFASSLAGGCATDLALPLPTSSGGTSSGPVGGSGAGGFASSTGGGQQAGSPSAGNTGNGGAQSSGGAPSAGGEASGPGGAQSTGGSGSGPGSGGTVSTGGIFSGLGGALSSGGTATGGFLGFGGLSAGGSADAGPPAGQASVLTIDSRAVTIYVPHVDKSRPLPVVFSLHGLSIPAIFMADVTGLPALADKEGFIAVFPEGANGTWNTGGAACGLGAFAGNANDDVAFTQKILAEIEKQQAIDRTHVYLSGFSMGGYGTNNLMCQRPDLFRAGAAASGGRTPAPCKGPAPIIIFHGTSDGTIAYDCGVQARAAWVLNNGCSTEVDTVQVAGGKCEYSRGCPPNAQVAFCSFNGMGHGWAGSLDPFALGGPQYESATKLMWDFFKNNW